MCRQNFLTLIAVIFASASAAAADVEVQGDNYAATAYFTAELADGTPGEKIETAHLGMERIVLFTEWRDLSETLHFEEVRVYDAYDALVYVWNHEFTPIAGSYNVWFWWCLCENRDLPGQWRFEVDLDGEPAFENRIVVGERE